MVNMAFVPDEPLTYRTTFQKSVAILKPDKEKVLPKYLYYQLQSCVDGFVNQSNGSAQKNLLLSTMRTFKMCIHDDIYTQARVVAVLTVYDDLIKNNQKQIKLLEEAAQRLYKEWFVDLRFPGYEDAEIVNGVPEGWHMSALSEMVDILMGQSPKSEFYNQESEGLPFHQGVGSYGERFVKDDIYSRYFTRVAEAGSILFSVRAPVGRLNITKNRIVIGRGLAAMNHKGKLQSYLFYMLKDRFFKEDMIGNGSIFASISKDELLAQKFTIPTDELVKKFDSIAASMDSQIKVLDSRIRLLSEARDRLLPKLVSGEMAMICP